MAQGGGFLDLEKEFAFYGAYHKNPINVFIHMICVWPILYSTLLFLQFVPPFFLISSFSFNLSFAFGLVYSLFYIVLEPKSGSFAALLCFLCWLHTHYFALSLGFSLAWKVVLAAQLLCWTAQFIGHGVFEKRAPALLDNLVQAFMMAPFFVLLEFLGLFGYEPYPGFYKKVDAQVEANKREWEDSKRKNST